MPSLASLCVYCGSAAGQNPRHAAAAALLGQTLARENVTLVYGGGRIGLMGILADACLSAGGKVIGIIPDFLHQREVAHPYVTELRLVDSMHERKQAMFDVSDAFAVLPGGLGTLDEAFEMLTWAQLGRHKKPMVFIDEGGYWRPFAAMVDHIVAEGFAKPRILKHFAVVPDVASVLPEVRKRLPA
jgi:uncharacterized protein (TIGR00730 family)